MEGGYEATSGSDYNSFRAGASRTGGEDKVLSPKKPFSALSTSNQEPTLSARSGSGASPPSCEMYFVRRMRRLATRYSPLATPPCYSISPILKRPERSIEETFFKKREKNKKIGLPALDILFVLRIL